jgi:hypothetical protein
MLNESELPLNDRKGNFGVIYLRAVAAVAGYGASVPESDFDSIDLKLCSRSGKRYMLDFQVKCTALPPPRNGEDFSFELSKKNYDDLRVDTIAPRYLFVVIVPDDAEQWLRQNERRMHVRHCGYWLSLKGFPDVSNTTSVTVRIPRRNVLTPYALTELMTGGTPQ